MDTHTEQMQRVDQYIAEQKKDAAVNLLFELIVSSARQKDFKQAETLRQKLFDVDSLALDPIIKSAEIIEAEKNASIDQTHLTAWREFYDMLSPEEAKEKLEEFSEKGYVHSIFWYGEMPQSICVCNCDAKYCYAARPKTWYDIENAFRRAEYLAVVNSDECISCGNCMECCQFGAITLGNEERAVVDQTICFGCGQCRGVCEQNALKLVDRNTHPIAQKIW